jgi:hypothetical protein
MDKSANASSLLKANESSLKAIPDVDTLISTVLDLVGETVGVGMSEGNWKKFQMDLMKSAEFGIDGVRRFLYNYALKGYDNGVIQLRREGMKEIAATILEHADILFRSKASIAELKLAKAVEDKIGTTIDESAFEEFVDGMPDNPKQYHRYLAHVVAKSNKLSLFESEEQAFGGLLTESCGTQRDTVAKKMRKFGFFLG